VGIHFSLVQLRLRPKKYLIRPSMFQSATGFFSNDGEDRYCFQIIDPATKRAYSRRTSIYGQVLARASKRATRNPFAKSIAILEENGEKHA